MSASESKLSELRRDPIFFSRYRVYRRSGKIEWPERIEDNWRPYNPVQIR